MVQPLLTSDQVAAWRSRLEQIAEEERQLATERSNLERKLEAVAVLFGGLPEEIDDDEQPPAVADAGVPDTRSRGNRPSWPSEIARIFEDCGGPMSFPQLKDEIEKGPLKGEYAKSEKGFYHAISRFQRRGYLKKHKGWLFRSQDLDVHLRKVEAGEIQDVRELSAAGPNQRSPMGEEVKLFVRQHPEGTTSADVIEYLKQDERFVDTLTKNATGAYNVISRLVKRGAIRKEGRTIFPLKENEPPEGGSEAEEVAPSSSMSTQDDHGDPRSLFS